uniref:O-acyltransferase WSD1 C-terminal domain-containing protein n=1 Tax=Anopheles atroparvus TaxID=41427 RepID=A0A182IN45_ANOAO
MTLKTGNFLDWASGEASSIFEAMARNFTPSGSFGPTTVAKGCVSERLDPFLSTSQLGILSGVVLFLFLRHKLSRWREELSHLKVASGTNIRQEVYTFLTFIEFLALSPVFLVVLITFHLCRITVGFVLRWRHGKHFKGLLDGADVVWAIEDQNSRGMINILASVHESFVDFESVDGSMSADLLLTLRKRISGRLMRNYQPHPKMFWKRNVELGYYFWSDQSELTIEDYIRYLDTIPLAEGQRSIDECQLRTLLSKINNRHLLANHTSSWEVLVGRQPLVDECRKIIKYPINYWIISKMTSLFPEIILRKILKSAHSTLAISNLPGPQQMPRIQGRELKNLCFFIPNLGTTAVGITLLTYGGTMQLGILADRAVIPNEDDAHSILQGTIEEIERMGKLLEEV